MIDHVCPKCGTCLSSPEAMAGKAETCPDCGNVNSVPSPQSMRASVPNTSFQPMKALQSQQKQCPKCKEWIAKEATKCPRCRSQQPAPAWITVLVLIILVGGGYWFCKGSSSTGNSPDSTVGDGNPSAPLASSLSVSAEQLIRDYHANEVSADERYKDKACAVTGVIETIAKDFMDDPYVTLHGDGALGMVRCEFGKSQQSILGRLSQGQRVIITGKCTGMVIGSVGLKDCRLN